MKKFYFMSGLPRSGSTLLSSILNQNPEIHASSNSPMCGMMFNLERSILFSEQYNAYPKPEVMPPTIMGVIDGYYSDVNKPTVIDKSRDWAVQEYFQVLLRNLPYQPKVVITVRDILEILASFIHMVNKDSSGQNFIDKEIQSNQEFNFYRHVNDIRCDHLMRPKGIIDNSLYGIAYSLLEENREYFHLVEYNDIVNNTEETIENIYMFLGEKTFSHDLKNIVNTVKENDLVYGISGMHDIRPQISKRSIDVEEVLSPYVRGKYSNLEFWRNV